MVLSQASAGKKRNHECSPTEGQRGEQGSRCQDPH